MVLDLLFRRAWRMSLIMNTGLCLIGELKCYVRSGIAMVLH